MSLPNYLQNIKSSGIYRFVWDKSQIEGVPAETLRLVVGYSEKGPFNTPVYIKTPAEFTSIYGNISKKLEKRGVYFHRLAIQALEAGPILALNIKKFANEKLGYLTTDVQNQVKGTITDINLTDVYDTTRFWKLEPNELIKEDSKYINIATTKTKESSCSVFMRGEKVKGYDITIKSWYSQRGEEVPAYLEEYSDMLVSQFFATIYVFRGQFTKEIASSNELSKYFNIDGENVNLNPFVTNAFGEKIDTLNTLAQDPNSNFIKSYTGILLPQFKDNKNGYISLDLLFNYDNFSHNMLMQFNNDLLDEGTLTADKLDTTGWNMLTDAMIQELLNAKINDDKVDATIFNTLNILLNNNIIPTISLHAIKEDAWEAKIIENSELSLINFADTVIDGNNIKSIDKKLFGELGIVIGDRFIGEDNKIITLNKIVTNDTNVDLIFSANIKKITNTINEQLYIVKLNNSLSTRINTMSPLYFEGYTYTTNAKPTDLSQRAKLSWQQEILKTLVDYSGLREALTNRIDIDYRYIVDTFEGFAEEECKSILSLIAKEKDNALAFLNFPAAQTFKKCDYTSFTDAEGRFQVKYIADGGNRSKKLEEIFSLASEANGASFASYNTPVKLSDGTVKTICPAAALVSNNFMEKYKSRQPYYIVAGPNYGKIVEKYLVGPDFNYSRADLDVLEPMGVNALVYIPRKGTFINSNQTAKQNPVSALSKINVRELVIFLQDEIEKLLQNYQWEFNTQVLRDTIKAKADSICENVKANGGIFAYLNVCDDSNNSEDVINNEMIVLSTSIEPGIGAGKMVQELTIYKTGGMKSLIK